MKSPKDFKSVFIHRDAVDMRKSINGLSEIVQTEGVGSLMGPSLFVFAGKRKNTIKILYFDHSGFALWMKRLEKDKFPWPKKSTNEIVEISPEQLSWLLDGYDVWKLRPFEALHFEQVC